MWRKNTVFNFPNLTEIFLMHFIMQNKLHSRLFYAKRFTALQGNFSVSVEQDVDLTDIHMENI